MALKSSAFIYYKEFFAFVKLFLKSCGRKFYFAVAFADIAAVVVSCLMIMSFSGKIRNRKNKKLYVVMLGGYNIILTCTFVHRTLAVLWK